MYYVKPCQRCLSLTLSHPNPHLLCFKNRILCSLSLFFLSAYCFRLCSSTGSFCPFSFFFTFPPRFYEFTLCPFVSPNTDFISSYFFTSLFLSPWRRNSNAIGSLPCLPRSCENTINWPLVISRPALCGTGLNTPGFAKLQNLHENNDKITI